MNYEGKEKVEFKYRTMAETNIEVKHLNYIDALRGLAILLVLAVHVGQNSPGLSSIAYFILSKGKYGVQMFFIASALTLFMSYEQRQITDAPSQKLFFFIRRFFRIAPAYYLAIGFYALLILLNGNFNLSAVNWLAVAVSFLFLNILYPLSINYLPPGGWTIAAEMLFYLTIPYLFLKLKNLSAAIWFFFLAIIGNILLKYGIIYLAASFLHKTIAGDWYLYYWFPNQLPVFALGIICFYLLKKPLLWSFGKVYGILLMSLAWFLVVFWLDYKYQLPYEHILISLGFCAIVLAMTAKRVKILQNSVIEFIGKNSFSMYLSHFFLIDLSVKYFPKDLFPPVAEVFIRYVLVLIATVLVSWLMNIFIESKGRKLGKQIILGIVKKRKLNLQNI